MSKPESDQTQPQLQSDRSCIGSDMWDENTYNEVNS
jgi:hypothetical protein